MSGCRKKDREGERESKTSTRDRERAKGVKEIERRCKTREGDKQKL